MIPKDRFGPDTGGRYFRQTFVLLGILAAGLASNAQGSSSVGGGQYAPLFAQLFGQVADEYLDTMFIRGGKFTMGNPLGKKSPEYHPDEPLLTVTMHDFKIGKRAVTASEFSAFLNSSFAEGMEKAQLYSFDSEVFGKFSAVAISEGRYAPVAGAEKSPANLVTWLGAVKYCEWLSTETGGHYRLPSEAEWEYAAARHGEVLDMGPHVTGEWCANKFIARPTVDGVVDHSVDLDDLETPRVVRGYIHRLKNRKRRNIISWIFLPEVGHHDGRIWTRVGIHPIMGPRQAARHGLRIVEDLSEEGKENDDPR